MSILSRGLVAAVLLGFFPTGLRAELGSKAGEKEAEKKARPELDHDIHEKGSHEKDSHDDFHERQVEDGEKNLKEIQRLLDEIQDGLASKQTGETTQKRQGQVIKRLDQLIKKLSKTCAQCQKGGRGSNSPQPSQGNSQSRKQKAADESQEEAERREQQNQRDQTRLEEEKNQQKEKDNPGKVPNKKVADDKSPDNKGGKLRPWFRGGSDWGRLPPKMREELLSTRSKDAPPEYSNIVERYFRRLGDYYDRQRGR